MIPELRGYALIFRTTHQLFHRELEGITPEQALQRRDGANPILWIAGHIVTVRSSFQRGIDGAVDVTWAKHCGRRWRKYARNGMKCTRLSCHSLRH